MGLKTYSINKLHTLDDWFHYDLHFLGLNYNQFWKGANLILQIGISSFESLFSHPTIKIVEGQIFVTITISFANFRQ